MGTKQTAAVPEQPVANASPWLTGLMSRTVVLSLVLMAVTLGAILLALNAFTQYRLTVSQLAEHKTQELMTANLLRQQTESLVSSSALLLLANNHFQRREAMFEVADRAEWIDRLISQLAALRATHEQFEEIRNDRDRLVEKLARLDVLVQQRIDLRQQIERSDTPNQADLTQLADIETQLVAVIQNTRQVSSNLGVAAGYQVTVIRDEVGRTVADLNTHIASQATLLKAAAAAVFVSVLVLVIFIQFSVVQRIRRLQSSMSQPRPLPGDIEVKGSDEIAHMGTTIRRYVDNINAKEERILLMNRELNFLATHDALTQLHNRHYFEQTLNQHGKALQAKGFSAAMIDIDHFKRINDNFGHAVGDQALRHVAMLMRRSLPEGVLLARYGGEEFAVLASGVSFETTQQWLEQLRQLIAATPLRVGDIEIMITVSIGLAPQLPGGDVSQAFKAADECLYLAKRSGRNCVTVRPLRKSDEEEPQ